MMTASLPEARQAVVSERVMDGVAAVLADGEELTFARVAAAAGVPERTLYRHFPSREALLTAVRDWVNERIGVARPTTASESTAFVRHLFPVFDELAPVVRELLRTPAGLAARLSDNDQRRADAIAVVADAAPTLDSVVARRAAAAIQLLTSATAWQALGVYWELDGPEAAETAATAIELILAGARARSAEATSCS